MRKHFKVAACLAMATVALTSAPASGATEPLARPAAVGEHCSIKVVGQKPSGELVTTAPRCFTTTAAVQRDSAARLVQYVAIHYKQSGFTGPSLSVEGNTCGGGWVNFSGSLASWRNAIVSTRHVECPVVRHWSGFNKTGAVDYHAYPAANLDSLIAASSSASYHNS